MKCSYITDKDTLEPCENQGSYRFWGFLLCDEHNEEHSNRVTSSRNSTVYQSANYHLFAEFPGYCYFILLPDGSIKIGYSNTDRLLKERFTSLSRTHKAPVVELVTIPGGFVAEAVLHRKFSHLRIAGPGERFTYGPEIAEYISQAKTGNWDCWKQD